MIARDPNPPRFITAVRRGGIYAARNLALPPVNGQLPANCGGQRAGRPTHPFLTCFVGRGLDPSAVFLPPTVNGSSVGGGIHPSRALSAAANLPNPTGLLRGHLP